MSRGLNELSYPVSAFTSLQDQRGIGTAQLAYKDRIAQSHFGSHDYDELTRVVPKSSQLYFEVPLLLFEEVVITLPLDTHGTISTPFRIAASAQKSSVARCRTRGDNL